MSNCRNKSDTIRVSEKLDISESGDFLLPEVPEEIIYPNELNTYLREQLRYYVHKNGMLEKNLNELEERYSTCKENVSKLEFKLSDYESICDKSKINTSSQLISSKIIELSKKLREKTSEVESLKTKYSKLEKQAYQLKNQLENDPQKYSIVDKAQAITPPNSLNDDDIKKLNDKISHLTNKVAEAKNMNMELKREMKLAKKMLQQEVGESFENLQAIYNANYAGWRGRAQMICDLQQKNSDLKEKLKLALEKCPAPIEVPQNVNKYETQLNALYNENVDLKSRIEDLKKKLEAAKARCKVLDMEYTVAKSKLSTMKDQNTNDQKTISTLSKQINSAKEAQNVESMQKDQAIIKLQTENKQLSQEMEEYISLVKGFREEINGLRNKINQQKENKEMIPNIPEKIYINQVNKATETEDKYQDVLKVVETVNHRLNVERENHGKTQSLLRLEKHKLTKAEALIAKMELETSNRGSYSSSSCYLRPLEQNLADNLELAEETLKATQTRLEIEQLERKADLQTFTKILKSYNIQIPEAT
ncbi:unnamed protein product [Psylliodes chrysocephalus]|uniref:Uncharacterized protein n=1 Tax=Psylliodes chrysocephalus TaxID=3402493 RepID=A0A9P0CQI1_9CUCU|nr:unnamed protein product [Psylliodes chrysocephala]